MVDRTCLLLGSAIILGVLVLDQLSKYFFIGLLGSGPPVEVTAFFNLAMVWNTGISFGMFAQHDQPYILAGLSLVICALLARWLLNASSKLVAGALGSVIGGALGNVIDRLYRGAVADFFDFHIGGLHWPAFNIADAAIFIGVVLLCVHSMFMERNQKP